MHKAKNDMKEEVYNKLEEDGGKKMTYKLAPAREEDGKDMEGGEGREGGD